MARRSRLSRVRKKKEQRQAFFYLLLAAGVMLVLLFWGIPVFARFAGIFLDKGIDGDVQSEFLAPPTVYSLPEATSSASIDVEGYANSGAEIILYLNNTEEDSLVTDKAGTFNFKSVDLRKGENSIYAVAKSKSRTSKNSRVQKIIVDAEKPKIVIKSPEPGSEIKGEENKFITIEGEIDEKVSLRANDQVVILSPSQEFSYRYQLEEGENKIDFVATDRAGNEVSETVVYRFTQ